MHPECTEHPEAASGWVYPIPTSWCWEATRESPEDWATENRWRYRTKAATRRLKIRGQTGGWITSPEHTPVAQGRWVRARYSRDCISCKRDAVRSKSKALRPSRYSSVSGPSAEMMRFTFRS